MKKPSADDIQCRRCALLSAKTAQNIYECWIPGKCPSTRHYIKNQTGISQQRRKKRIEVVHKVMAPEIIYGNLLVWRELRQDAPIHGIGAEVWDNEKKLAEVAAVHCAGWLPSQVHSYIQKVLVLLENEYGFQKFASQIIQHPEQCPIRPCPLHSAAHAMGTASRSN